MLERVLHRRLSRRQNSHIVAIQCCAQRLRGRFEARIKARGKYGAEPDELGHVQDSQQLRCPAVAALRNGGVGLSKRLRNARRRFR